MTVKTILQKLVQIPHFTLFLVLLITATVYLTSIPNDFVWDDYFFIPEWQEIRDLPSNLVYFLKGGVPQGHEGAYRPLRSIFYALSFQVCNFNASCYHLQGVLVHLLATFFVYKISHLLLKNKSAALMSGLIFGIHPLHVEAISWITASFDSIGNLFYLISFYYFLVYRKSKEKRNFWQMLVFALLAFFTTEITLTLPLLFLLYDYLNRKLKKTDLPQRAGEYAWIMGANILFWITRQNLFTPDKGLKPILDSTWATVLVMIRALWEYFRLLLIPYPLTVNHKLREDISAFYYHDYNFEKLAQMPKISDPDILFSLIFVLLLLFLGFQFRKKLPLVTLAIGIFFLNLLPVMQFYRRGVIFSERFVYLSSLSLTLIIALIYKSLSPSLQRLYLVLVFGYALGLSYLTLERGRDWQDSVTLWQKSIETMPESSTLHANLGGVYAQQGNLDEAEKWYLKSIQINPNNINSHNILANIYFQQGKYDLLNQQLETILKIRPNDAQLYIKLAESYKAQGKIQEAVENYRKAMLRDPSNSYVKTQIYELTKP